MALIIKADMPKNCYDCYIKKNWTFDYICPLMDKDADLDTWLRADCRHPSCPILGEISDEHGRLKDYDKIKEVLTKNFDVNADSLVYYILSLIDETDTVLEANT